jgi:hypothetical protein
VDICITFWDLRDFIPIYDIGCYAEREGVEREEGGEEEREGLDCCIDRSLKEVSAVFIQVHFL